MDYKASGIIEYPEIAWPLIATSFLEINLCGIIFLLFKKDVVTPLVAGVCFGLLVVLMYVELVYIKKLNGKLEKRIIIDERGVRIIDVIFENVIFLKEIYEHCLAWDDIQGIELSNSWKGPIELHTTRGMISLWFGFRPEINQKIVSEIKEELARRKGSGGVQPSTWDKHLQQDL